MALARTHAIALLGVSGAPVEVEANISAGLPAFIVIGLPDAALSEARDRVRAAAVNAGFPLTSHKLVVGLSPADLPKHGSGFDLAIAVASLAAAGTISPESVAEVAHLGELGLDGRLRPIAGILPAVLAARRAGLSRVMVPTANAAEARLVPDITVIPAASLQAAAIHHGAEADPVPVEPVPWALETDDEQAPAELADVVGHEEAVEALVAAAAGGHHLFLLGPPGAGKTMLAERLPGILPDLDTEASLEATSIRSLSGRPVGDSLVTRPPFEAPHHTATAAAMVGGGSGRIRPGAVVRASSGVLFLDESPEFSGAVLDALRQPLESGSVSIHRSKAVATFPARFQLVLAANPCPCGGYGSNDVGCGCAPNARRRYLGRLSGPLLDRVDIRLRLNRVTATRLRLADETPRLTTAQARSRVEGARALAAERLADTPWRTNAAVPGAWLRERRHRPGREARAPLDRALERGEITMRGYDRILRLAWTLSDLDGAGVPRGEHVGRAVHLRGGGAA